jgi:hypothetical protein
VPGLGAAVLKGIVGRAADLCPVSNPLRGNVKVFVRSDLAPSVETTHEPGENTPPPALRRRGRTVGGRRRSSVSYAPFAGTEY